MRMYISGPITGIPNYHQIFDEAKLKLMEKGYKDVINPAELDAVFTDAQYEDYMDVCFKLIDMSDIILLLKGWKDSEGCRREVQYAEAKTKIIVEARNWLDE